ncbi:MAG: alpha-ketoglutarate-dependent dioxygenase AlkB [Acidimicrobiaceae bacterium]|nr:alpha-ketoglutarate-dependent dioxygenase AlkB [Acidimicrobiaceae bacterium]
MREAPDHEWYPGFLHAAETRPALDEIILSTPWRHDEITLFGRTHPVPRLTALYGDPGAHYSYSRLHLEPLTWTKRLAEWRDRVRETTGCRTNSVLLNYYRDGRDSNGWHADDEPELGAEPVIASLSLGATRTMRFRRRDDSARRWSVELADGDLLVMRGDSQREWLHTVAKSARVSDPRVNLTFRWIEDTPPVSP